MTRFSTVSKAFSYAYVAKLRKVSDQQLAPEISQIDVDALIGLYEKDKKDQIEGEFALVLNTKDYNKNTHPRHVRCHDGKYRRIHKYICHLMLQEYWCCPSCGCENSMEFDKCQHPLGCSFGFDNPEACQVSSSYDYSNEREYDNYEPDYDHDDRDYDHDDREFDRDEPERDDYGRSYSEYRTYDHFNHGEMRCHPEDMQYEPEKGWRFA